MVQWKKTRCFGAKCVNYIENGKRCVYSYYLITNRKLHMRIAFD